MDDTLRLSPQKISVLWKASFVRRWHTNEHLSQYTDHILGHSGRVAVLLRSLWPRAPAEALWAAIAHDLPEYIVGDVSAVSKQDNPEFDEALRILEHETAKKMECSIAETVSLDWAMRLDLCDKLDALLFAQLHRPDLMRRGDWINSKARVFQMAGDCEVHLEVAEIIRWAA